MATFLILILIAVFGILAIIFILLGIFLYFKIKADRFARELGAKNFGDAVVKTKEALDQSKVEASKMPKSVTDVSSIKLPAIVKDFPEFNYNEMKERAEVVLRSYFKAVTEENTALLEYANAELFSETEDHIEGVKAKGRKERFDSVHVHKTAISDYVKKSGRCIVTFQSAVQYLYTLKNLDGKLLEGDEYIYEQKKYEVKMIYIQDRDAGDDNYIDGAKSLTCPSCGAPLKMLGAKKCEYCGCPIAEFNIKIWTFSEVVEIC